VQHDVLTPAFFSLFSCFNQVTGSLQSMTNRGGWTAKGSQTEALRSSRNDHNNDNEQRRARETSPSSAGTGQTVPVFQSALVEQLMRQRWTEVLALWQRQRQQAERQEVVVYSDATPAWKQASKSLTRPRFPDLVQQALQRQQQSVKSLEAAASLTP
jgi:hypothetical protein